MHASGPVESAADAVRIREEAAADAGGIYEVHRRAFGRPDEAGLVDRLRASSPEYISLVAEINSRIVGHVLFTPVEIGSGVRRIRGMGLAPLGVLPEFQQRGIGAQLIREGLEAARRAGAAFVVVVGEPAYYGRFGFAAASGFGIACEFEGVPDEAFMLLAFDPPSLEGAAGTACYHSEFRSLA